MFDGVTREYARLWTESQSYAWENAAITFPYEPLTTDLDSSSLFYGYRVTAQWGDNIAEYVFVLHENTA